MKTSIKLLIVGIALLFFASCKKDSNEKLPDGAILKVQVTFNGDFDSQVAGLTFHAEKSSNNYIDIINEKTGNKSSAPVLSNTNFTPGETISFRSVDKIKMVNVYLTIGPKISDPGTAGNLSVTVKIYMDGVLKDSKTHNYDQRFDINPTPKQFDYSITAN